MIVRNVVPVPLLMLVSASLFADSIELQNEFWNIRMEPDHGARASSIVYKPKELQAVNTWNDRNIHGKDVKFAGAFGGHVTGSYLDEQIHEPYRIVKSEPNRLHLDWHNRHVNFDGLKEDREIIVDGKRIILRISITNEAKEPRRILYRLQDFIGIGRGVGTEKIAIVPGRPTAVFSLDAQTESDQIFIRPTANGLIFCDYARDFGMMVSSRTGINGIYVWAGRNGTTSNTLEFFLPQTTLTPGSVWSAEFTYQAFQPSRPDDLPAEWRPLVAREFIESELQRRSRTRSVPLPYNSVCTVAVDPAELRIYPLAPADVALGKDYPTVTDATLHSVKLFGTPGERVDLALALKAGTQKIDSPWQFSELNDGDRRLAANWQLRYVSSGGYFLVRDQQLARTGTEALGRFNNGLSDTPTWTDLKLAPDEKAWVKLSCRIPEDAAPGFYRGTIAVAGRQVAVELRVMPFRLNRDQAKTFGSFFRVFTANSNPEWTMSRGEYLDALRFADDHWNNGMFIYVGNAEDLRWSFEQIQRMGWKDAVICPISTLLPAREIREMERRYGFRILTWGVDEPATYKALGNAGQRLELIRKGGYCKPTFTPSTFMGMIFADMQPDYIPVFNTNGMMTILMEKTREYRRNGRSCFWYSCPTGKLTSNQQIRERMLHGVYLWNAPTDGIFDWGEDVAVKEKQLGGYCGFLGKKMISTVRRDNNFEGYKDYLYLKTLQDTVGKAGDTPAAREARNFLANLPKQLDDNYFETAQRFDHSTLDALRRQAAELTAALLEPAGK